MTDGGKPAEESGRTQRLGSSSDSGGKGGSAKSLVFLGPLALAVIALIILGVYYVFIWD